MSSSLLSPLRATHPRLGRCWYGFQRYGFAARAASSRSGTNPNLHFPCVEKNENRLERQFGQAGQNDDVKVEQRQADRHVLTPETSGTERLAFVDPKIAASAATQRSDLLVGQDGSRAGSGQGGPEPAYSKVVTGYKTFSFEHPFLCDHGGLLPRFDIAYEAWGTMNEDRSNVILLHTGLSASSHAKSHAQNPSEGWWEKFIGPGLALDTDKFYIICTNVLGGCYGSTGPYSLDPSDNLPYATRFPIITIWDMVRAQFLLLDHLKVEKLYASVGSSMGGMQSLAAASMYPDRVGKIISISGCARSHPYSIALRHTQRSILMSDPAWKRGHYYASDPPHVGMKLARQLATITYRSGPEWEQRFGRKRVTSAASPNLDDPILEQEEREENPPSLCPDFLIETYLDYQGERFCLQYDANSLIYISKAMDLFDMSASAIRKLAKERARHATSYIDIQDDDSLASLPVEQVFPSEAEDRQDEEQRRKRKPILTVSPATSSLTDLACGLENLGKHPTLVLGCQSDILFPCWQQREIAECLRINGNQEVVYYELDSLYGHDTFLIDYTNVGRAVKGFLELR